MKKTPNERIKEANKPEAAAKNIPADEAKDKSFRGSYNRAKSQVKGDNTIKQLKEIWTPKGFK